MHGSRQKHATPEGTTRDGVVIQIIEIAADRFAWALRKGDEVAFLRSHGHFAKASHAEANARQVIGRANKKVAYVESVSERA